MGTCPKCKQENFAYNDIDICPDCFDLPDDEEKVVTTFVKIKKKVIKEQ